MKAIILAAGRGDRMRPLTLTTHKSLLKIADRTIIQWIVDALLEFEITDLTIVTGYHAEDIKAHLTCTYPELAINYVHNERFGQTNNIYSMALAIESMSIDTDIITIEADVIFEPSALGCLLASKHANVALVDQYRSGMDGTVVTIDNRDVITSVIPPHLQGSEFDAGNKYKTLNIYRFSKEFVESTFRHLLTFYATVIDDNCYYELILGIIIYLQKEVVHAVILGAIEWAEIDNPNDLDRARFVFEGSKQKEILDRAFGGYWCYDILDFCFIRNMYFPTSAVVAELRNNLDALITSYGSSQDILNRKMAYYLLCKQEYVTALNGASQIYPLVQRYFCGKRALMPSPSFGEYSRIFPKAVTYADEVGFDTGEILEHAQSCDLVVFVNPNNPTGSILAASWIYHFAAAHPDKTVLLDESFVEFSATESILILLDEVPLPNVIVLKSLSKVLGVPGIRLGCVYSSNAHFNAYLKAEIPIWNLNSVAENFLEIILKYRNDIQASFRQTILDREQFSSHLEELAVVERVYPSGGNFLLVSLRCDPVFRQELVRRLLSQYGIYVRDVSDRFRGQKSFLRLAVRRPAENERLVQSLTNIMAEMSQLEVSAGASSRPNQSA